MMQTVELHSWLSRQISRFIKLRRLSGTDYSSQARLLLYFDRSAILGMLAAAAGIRRDEEAKHLALEQGYGMAVRMESAGTFLKDYHTTQVPPQVAMKKHPGVTRRDELMALSSYQKTNPKTSGTILSNRAYRCDGLYQIALWEREQENTPFGLYHLIDCLNHPRFVLYLGRKSCPLALPLQPHIVESATVVDAYEQAKFISLRSIPSP